MRFCIGIPALNQKETTQKCLNLIRQRTPAGVQIIIVDNGSNPPVRDWLIGLQNDDQVIRNQQNVGLTKALNQIYRIAVGFENEWIINIHNDVYIYEDGWVEKLDRILREVPNVGVAGFFGAYGIGTSDIYRVPYDFRQLARTNPVSGMRCRVAHGQLRMQKEWDYVAVLDGFSLITNVKMLGKVGGFDYIKYPIHHMYDQATSLESINAGYKNIVVDMDVDHHGGLTDVGENWAEPFGKTKDQVHKEAHPPFYEDWRPGRHNICLPYRVI
jgi:GT2 family glycosyltransferase